MIVIYDGLYFSEFPGTKTKIESQTDWGKPKFCRLLIPVDVDMRRLIWFMTIKIEAVRTSS